MTLGSSSTEINACDVMSTPVATVDATSGLWQAGDLMISLGIHHVVVVDSGHCIGVLTDRDLLEAWYRGPTAIRGTPVSMLIATSTSCVLPDSPIRHLASIMNVNHVDAVPVVDESGRLLGLVTAGDVVHAVATYGLMVLPNPAACD